MNERLKSWVKRNGPLVILGALAIIALLSLGDDIVRDRQSRISITPIIPQVEKDDPWQGGEDAPAIIIVFSDFTCNACKEQSDIMKAVVNDLGNQVKVVWKDAPLDQFKAEAMNASIAAHCAGKQNKFWEMHDLLYEKQSSLGAELYVASAKELQLDESAFAACYEKQQTLEKVKKNISQSQEAKVTATPTLIIKGVFYEGVVPYEEILSQLSG